MNIPSNSVMVSIPSINDCTGHGHCQSSIMVCIPNISDCTRRAHC